MKVGDLVELSSYGKARDYNSMIDFYGPAVGLIIKSSGRSPDRMNYEIKWSNVQSGRTRFHRRKELKYAKIH